MKIEEVKVFLDEFCHYRIVNDVDDALLHQILDFQTKDVPIFYVESNKSENFVLRNYLTNEICIIWDISFWKHYIKFIGLVQQLQSEGANNEIVKLLYASTSNFLKYRVIDNNELFEYFDAQTLELGINDLDNMDTDTSYINKILLISKVIALYHEVAHINFDIDVELKKSEVVKLKKEFTDLFMEDGLFTDEFSSFYQKLKDEEKELFKEEEIFSHEDIEAINYYKEKYAQNNDEQLWEEMAADYYSAKEGFLFIMKNYGDICSDVNELATYIFDAIDLLNYFNSGCSAIGEFWDYAKCFLRDRFNLREIFILEKRLNKKVDEINAHSILRNTIVNGMIISDILESEEGYFNFSLLEIDWIPFYKRSVVDILNDIFGFWCSSELISDVAEYVKDME